MVTLYSERALTWKWHGDVLCERNTEHDVDCLLNLTKQGRYALTCTCHGGLVYVLARTKGLDFWISPSRV